MGGKMIRKKNLFRSTLVLLGALILLPVALADLSDIQAKGTATIAMSGEYPPFSMPDENGEMIGMDADVARELAKRLGVEPILQQAEFSSIIAGIQSGAFDFSVASHSVTEERKKAVTFSDIPYYYGGGQMFIHKDLDYTSLDEMAADNAVIAVDLGGTNQQYLESVNYPRIDTYSGVQDELLAVASGRAAAIFTNPVVGFEAVKAGQPIKAMPGLIFEENAYVLMAKGSSDLEAAINQALRDMRADGTLLEISMKWIGGDIVTPPSE
jgi:ABC-type amino acid transport substrate-binding protein